MLIDILGDCSQRKDFAPSSGSEFFPLREVSSLNRVAIDENPCLSFEEHSGSLVEG